MYLVVFEKLTVDIQRSAMKTLAIILVLGFAWQPNTTAFRMKESETCLIENGFTDSPSDLGNIESIGEDDLRDTLKDVSKEKLAAVVACIYKNQYADKNLNDVLKALVDRDDKVSEDDAKKMKETLSSCNTNAAGDNAKLLLCVNYLAPPFDRLVAVIRDIPESQDACFLKCGLTIGEMYKMEQNRNKMKDVLKHVSEEKMACLFGCKADQDMRPDRTTISQRISETINRSKVHDENQKKEMLETLKRCTDTVAGKENENHLLVKCVELFKPPFVDIYG